MKTRLQWPWAALMFVFWGLGCSQAAMAAEPVAKAKDLAVILPALGQPQVALTEAWFPAAWWQEITSAFARTSIGDALERESQKDDWRLVAVRVAPCQPLLSFLSERNETLCQPELRLVWQPVEQVFRGNRWQYYADDRAIHALYRFDPGMFLNAAMAERWRVLSERASSLTAMEEAEFGPLQRALAQAIVAEVVGLRQLTQASAYDDIGERPEFRDAATAKAFVAALTGFLQKYARPQLSTQVTAFSLPEGRDPPLLDEWVFVAFEPLPGGDRLKPQSLNVRSRRDGRVLVDYGESASVSVRRDEANLIDLFDETAGQERSELQDAVIWDLNDRRSKLAAIADPRRTHIAHTSCASCHKLSKTTFDMHNLSYFEDREITVSPRVERDVEVELEWLRRR